MIYINTDNEYANYTYVIDINEKYSLKIKRTYDVHSIISLENVEDYTNPTLLLKQITTANKNSLLIRNALYTVKEYFDLRPEMEFKLNGKEIEDLLSETMNRVAKSNKSEDYDDLPVVKFRLCDLLNILLYHSQDRIEYESRLKQFKILRFASTKYYYGKEVHFQRSCLKDFDQVGDDVSCIETELVWNFDRSWLELLTFSFIRDLKSGNSRNFSWASQYLIDMVQPSDLPGIKGELKTIARARVLHRMLNSDLDFIHMYFSLDDF